MNVYKKGFTLMELLVVISIIGLLASVVLSSLNTARAKARDSYRLSTLKQMQNALALYYSAHQEYPSNASVGGQFHFVSTSMQAAPALIPTFISQYPVDPQSTTPACTSGCHAVSSNFRYHATISSTGAACLAAASDCQGYVLITKLESKSVNGCYILGGSYNTTAAQFTTSFPSQYGGASEFIPCDQI